MKQHADDHLWLWCAVLARLSLAGHGRHVAHQGETCPASLARGTARRPALCADPRNSSRLALQAIDDAGGWHSDTVVEDMDLSLRSFLAGYKGHLMPHVGVDHENPDDMPTYRTQQYR